MRSAILRRATLRMAAAAGRALVLVYHRLRPGGPMPHDVVPTLASSIVRMQLEALAEVGDVVPLSELYEPGHTSRRVRFAITFDDDESSHVDHALPLLRSLGLRATFFLSGRTLHGLGPYWWHCLEQLIADRGLRETCRIVGVSAHTPTELAARCQSSAARERICGYVSPRAPDLSERGISTLVANGMDLGFHTVTHPVLTRLARADVEAALQHGRTELSAVAGVALRHFAYPHGRVNAEVARVTAASGYDAAFASGGRPITPRSDRFLLGRWEPGEMCVEQFLASVAARLIRRGSARPG